MPKDLGVISLSLPALWCLILQVSMDLAALTFISPSRQTATLCLGSTSLQLEECLGQKVSMKGDPILCASLLSRTTGL